MSEPVREAVARAIRELVKPNPLASMLAVADAAIAAYEAEKQKEREEALAEMNRIAREFNLP